MISTVTSHISFSKLKRLFKLKSEHTVKNYLTYLEEAYLLFFIPRFSFKPKEIETAERKIYSVDNGFITHVSYVDREEIGEKMENAVAVELLRRSRFLDTEIFYYKTKDGYEIDFLIKEGNKIKELIQVSYANSYEEIKEREIRALLHAKEDLNLDENTRLTVITWDYEDEKQVKWWRKEGRIRFIPLWKWLLN